MNPPSYQFYPERKFSLQAIKETYRDFFKKGLDFWISKKFDIELSHSVPVFLGVFLFSQLVSGQFNFFSILFVLGGLLFQFGLYLGLLVLMKEWLQARGSLKEYFAFLTYAIFVSIPFHLVTLLNAELGNLLKLFLSFWVFYCFYKTFRFNLVSYLILWALVFGSGMIFILYQITSRGLFFL